MSSGAEEEEGVRGTDVLEGPYLELLGETRERGRERRDRTGVGTRAVFGRMLRFDLARGFPAVTTKKLQFRSVVAELLWFLSGESNVAPLRAEGVHIWDPWADEAGELGPVYGVQWRRWPDGRGGTIDQIAALLEGLRRDPESRRHVVSAWNVADLPRMALAPCHVLFQFHVADGRLSCSVYQRSADLFLGVPFNIASYALLTHLVAAEVGLGAGELVWMGGDCHVYLNHFEAVDRQLARRPFPAPRLRLKRAPPDLFATRPEDIELVGYRHHPAIPAPIAV
jgi:thymidylate synthase